MIQIPKARDVLIVDDHPAVQRALEEAVQLAFADVGVRCANTLANAFRKSADSEHLDLVLLDLGLPGYPGIDAFIAARRHWPRVRIIVVSGRDDSDSILAVLSAGAAGFIPKTTPLALMVAELRLVHAGGIYVPPRTLAHLPSAPPHHRVRAEAMIARFTDRQKEVLRQLFNGLSNAEIAAQLGISESTVKRSERGRGPSNELLRYHFCEYPRPGRGTFALSLGIRRATGTRRPAMQKN